MASSAKRIEAISKNSSETGEVTFRHSVLTLFPQSLILFYYYFFKFPSVVTISIQAVWWRRTKICQEEYEWLWGIGWGSPQRVLMLVLVLEEVVKGPFPARIFLLPATQLFLRLLFKFLCAIWISLSNIKQVLQGTHDLPHPRCPWSWIRLSHGSLGQKYLYHPWIHSHGALWISHSGILIWFS